jgi:hypothetical protein
MVQQTRVRCVVDIGGRVENRSWARILKSRRCCPSFCGTIGSPMFQDREDTDCKMVNEGGCGCGMKLSVVGTRFGVDDLGDGWELS